MRRGLFPLLAVLAAGCGSSVDTPPPAGDGTVALTPLKASEFDAVIASHKGKVVLVDCWFLG
jgi:hypothetical protein